MDARHLSLPVVTIATMIGFFMWTTFIGVKEVFNFKNEFKDELLNVEKNLLGSINEKLDRIEQSGNLSEKLIDRIIERQRYINENMWTKQNHILWCYEAQKKNTNFICPDYSFLNQVPTYPKPVDDFDAVIERDKELQRLRQNKNR